MSESIDDTMLLESVTRVRRLGAFGVVVVVVAIVVLFTCCDIAKWLWVSARAYQGFKRHHRHAGGRSAR